MPVNKLTDIYSRETLDKAMIDESIRKSAVWGSGLVTIDPEISGLVGAGEARKFSHIGYVDIADPFLTGNAAQATTHNPGYPDDSDNLLIPNANATYMYDAVKSYVAYSMGQKEVIKTVSFLEDPVSALNGRVTDYWARYFDMYVTSMMKGIFLDNITNDNSDMVFGDGTAPVDGDSIIDAFATMGDAAEMGGSILIIHSKVAFALRKLQLIDSIPSADNPYIFFEYFQGNRVIVSDQVPVHSNGTDNTCVSILASPGVIEFGQSTNNIIPSEVWRDPRQAVGGGEEQLITRQQFAFHPKGFSWLDTTVTGAVASGNIPGMGNDKLWPCPADMALDTNWDRILDRKKVKISFLHTSELGGGIIAPASIEEPEVPEGPDPKE